MIFNPVFILALFNFQLELWYQNNPLTSPSCVVQVNIIAVLYTFIKIVS